MNTATEKQMAFIKLLAEQRDLSQHPGDDPQGPQNTPEARASMAAKVVLDVARTLHREGKFDKASASLTIDVLKAAPYLPKTEAVAAYEEATLAAAVAAAGMHPYSPRQALSEITDGVYRLDGVIYKVQRAVHGSGNLYAKRLVETDPGVYDEVNSLWTAKPEYAFVYAPGAVAKLRPEHRMTLEEAKQFGALYGTCCVCGRTLTNENSIEAGIGPVCASKF